jgi:hypothetical protein
MQTIDTVDADTADNMTQSSVLPDPLPVQNIATEKKTLKRVDEEELERLSRSCNTLKQQVTRNNEKRSELRLAVKRKFFWLVKEDANGVERRTKVAIDSIAEAQKRREIEKIDIERVTIKASLRDARASYAALNSSLREQNKAEKQYAVAYTRLNRDSKNYYQKVRINLGKASKNGHAEDMKGLKDLAPTDPLKARELCMKVLDKISPADAQLMRTYPSHMEKLMVEIFGPLPDGFQPPAPDVF